MQSQYLKAKHISEVICTVLSSGTWKWIIHSRSQALQSMSKKLGNGRNTLLWHDTRIPGVKLISHVNRAPTDTWN